MKIDKILKGGILTGLAAVMAITPVWAADQDTTGSGGEGESGTKTHNTTVTYSGTSTYTVTIPETITIGADKTAEYSVNVTGDLASGVTVNVTPASSFQMSATGKNSVTAYVTQETKSWTLTTLGTATTGKITATDLSAGEWTGTLTFTISAS